MFSHNTPPPSAPAPPPAADPFRAAVEDITGQLRRVADGDADARVRAETGDRTVDELAALVNTVLDGARRAEDEAHERNAELEQFAYAASHDLQEPLRMVTSFLQLLQRRYAGQLDATADEYIGYAVDGAKRMQGLIQDLLAFSRVSTHGQPLEPTDMEDVLEEVRRELGPAVAEAGARVTHGPLPTVVGDRPQLVQLLQNLLDNALKFRGGAPPEIDVSARREGPLWRFEVSDNGIGVAEEHRERVFQVFQRLHTREEYEGSGIGLAVGKRIVERHGGRMGVDPAPGGGSMFWFTLPADEEGGGNRGYSPTRSGTTPRG